jgi:hypothetical protein
MANRTGDPRGPGMKGSGGWFPVGVAQEEVAIKSTPGDVCFSFDNVYPWDGVYVRQDDALFISILAVGGQGVNLQYRLLRPDGQVLVSQETIGNLGTRSQNFVTRQLAEGVLLSVAVFPTPSEGAGTYTYVAVELRRQSLATSGPHQVLCAGYLSQACPLSWPGAVLQRPTDGAGIRRGIVGTTPAAGADISETVPANTRWQLLALRASLTTAVAAANRFPGFKIFVNGSVTFLAHANAAQVASTTDAYSIGIGLPFYSDTIGGFIIPFPTLVILNSGDLINSDTVAIQAADQWTAPVYEVIEWTDNV